MLQTTKIASPLSRKATLVKLEIKKYSARKLDRKATKEVNDKHGAAGDAGNYNKLLIEKNRLEKINGIATQISTLFHTMTKPWSDGVGILPNSLHGKFTDEIRVLKRDFADAVDEFCRDFPMFVEERKRRLAGLFNPADYPSAKEIRSKFKVETQVFPVPEADDFRSEGLDDDTVEDIRREIAETSGSILDGAMAHTKDELVKVIGHMSERLAAFAEKKEGDRTGTFRDTLVENVRELAELLPAFNFNNDPKFDALVKRIQNELCVEDADTLRENTNVRDTVKKSADDILKDVESLLG